MAGACIAWEYDWEVQLFRHFILNYVLPCIGHATGWDWIEYPNYPRRRLYFLASFQIVELVDPILLVTLQADVREYEYK